MTCRLAEATKTYKNDLDRVQELIVEAEALYIYIKIVYPSPQAAASRLQEAGFLARELGMSR